jgi:hypothetical protein
MERGCQLKEHDLPVKYVCRKNAPCRMLGCIVVHDKKFFVMAADRHLVFPFL